MSLDMSNARAAIKSRVLGLSSVSDVFTTEVKKGFTPRSDAYGRMEPYAVLHFGRPVPGYGRTIGDGEQDYPHLWPVSIFLYCSDGDSAENLADELDASFLDWSPDGDNSTGFRGGASFSYALQSTDNMPSRVELQRYFTATINLSHS
ncbi:hypothetical protein G7068_16175 [Leucobacter viscericola]|uniref:Uncharacterized protein n=1 Tax=Leucobacter viscericola TaxID=2714935 RepID=A0A6G7XIZ3_9MICO|nr:hypothetical protein [Leucobacter viscericola]QIK61802.1 hypothetical protein G7068_00185 [Leucobacter viscericola]QIK64584.1 hypothetical protein G7068_16175 [Leucobacter viscericola]